MTYAAEMFGGSTDFIAAWNHNETTVDDFDTALIDARRIRAGEWSARDWLTSVLHT
ncbi:MAG: hypothetical protein ACNYPE_17230 [Candidatus Azotimanducaceae bacterium WSBS_2022_MAG_OTU7]